uniref:Uncharacterized protein n=1 Tax=Arion vulgaris TaxID=1028688 RepID=A0A0B7AHL2_9EUPU
MEFQGCKSHALTTLREMGFHTDTAQKEQHTQYGKMINYSTSNRGAGPLDTAGFVEEGMRS